MLVAVVVLLGLWLNWLYSPSLPTLEAGQVESVTISLRRYEPNPWVPGADQDGAEITTTDPAVIRAFLDVFTASSPDACPRGGSRTPGGAKGYGRPADESRWLARGSG